MSKTHSARNTVAVFLLAGLLAASVQPALAGIEHPADAAAVNAVQLDMALFDKLAAASRDLKELPGDARDELEAARGMEKDDAGVLRATKVSLLLQVLNRHPGFQAVLARHGLTGRQYFLGLYAITNGSFAVMLAGDGEPAAADFAKWEINPAHYRFCKQHQAEISRLNQELND